MWEINFNFYVDNTERPEHNATHAPRQRYERGRRMWMNWTTLQPEQRALTLRAMHRYGGTFVQRLANAWGCADETNAAKLAEAFPELVTRYGPESGFYAELAMTGVRA